MQKNIEVLNDVTKILIDSEKGFRESAGQLDNEHLSLRNQLNSRAAQRSRLVRSFQSEVQKLGGEPETEGSFRGKVYQNFKKFTGLFKDDDKAALSAIDDGEDYLSDYIQDKLEDQENLTYDTRQLLKSAYKDSCEGERFAELQLEIRKQ